MVLTLTTLTGIHLFSLAAILTSFHPGFHLTGINTSDDSNPTAHFSQRIFTAPQYTAKWEQEPHGEDVQERTISVAAHTYSANRFSGNEIEIGRHDIVPSARSVSWHSIK